MEKWEDIVGPSYLTKEDREANKKARESLGLGKTIDSVEGISSEVLREAASVALRKFSPCQRGESVTDKELSMRLKELRDTGYPVEPYSGKSKKEKRDYLTELQSEIRKR